ncbi:hypothetical protein ACCO45_010780 [Purpureocillium lilacinum]|uniref:Uncharacterized protein n=1 Tax=Purpureocillium lilacinum TaxID=33203 RepID=A0ACC4DHC6_PURLI
MHSCPPGRTTPSAESVTLKYQRVPSTDFSARSYLVVRSRCEYPGRQYSIHETRHRSRGPKLASTRRMLHGASAGCQGPQTFKARTTCGPRQGARLTHFLVRVLSRLPRLANMLATGLCIHPIGLVRGPSVPATVCLGEGGPEVDIAASFGSLQGQSSLSAEDTKPGGRPIDRRQWFVSKQIRRRRAAVRRFRLASQRKCTCRRSQWLNKRLHESTSTHFCCPGLPGLT